MLGFSKYIAIVFVFSFLAFTVSTLSMMETPELRDYNECSYTCNAFKIRDGYVLGRDIFSHQPPLIFNLLSLSIDLFNNNFFSVRFPSFVATVILIFSLVFFLTKIFDFQTGLVAGIIASCFYPTLFGAGVAEGEMIALCFSVLSIFLLWYSLLTKKFLYLSLILSGFFQALGVFSKLIVLPFLPVLVIIFIQFNKDISLRAIFKFLMLFIFGVVVGCVFSLQGADVSGILSDSVLYQLGSSPQKTTTNPFILLFALFKANLVISILFLLSCLALFFNSNHLELRLVLRVWLYCTFLFICFHQPIFRHHLAILIPIVSIIVAMFVTGKFSWWKIPNFIWILVLPSILIFSYDRFQRNYNIKAQKTTYALIEELSNITAPGDLVISDRQNVTVILGRYVPPDLCDTSFVRVGRGYLDIQKLIDESKKAKAIVFWDGRLQNIDEYVVWVRENFNLYKSFGVKNSVIREIYVPKK